MRFFRVRGYARPLFAFVLLLAVQPYDISSFSRGQQRASMPGRNTLTLSTPYTIIDSLTVTDTWDGSPLTLNPNDNANMPITPNGSLVLAYQNTSSINTTGTLSVTTGGSAPTFYNAQSLQNQPNVLINNWKTSNLSITNVSPPGSNTPILISAYGPGMPGLSCMTLPSDGITVQLSPSNCLQGMAVPRYMQLIFQNTTGNLSIFVFIGGPVDASGNNAYMIAINAQDDTGPGTGKTPPPGYYATAKGTTYTYQFNWGSSNIYVANMSATSAQAAAVSLRKL